MIQTRSHSPAARSETPWPWQSAKSRSPAAPPGTPSPAAARPRSRPPPVTRNTVTAPSNQMQFSWCCNIPFKKVVAKKRAWFLLNTCWIVIELVVLSSKQLVLLQRKANTLHGLQTNSLSRNKAPFLGQLLQWEANGK